MNLENLNLILLYIALAQAIFAIVYMLFYKKLKHSSMLFLMFLIVYISPTIDHIIISSGFTLQHPRFFYTPAGFYYFLAPFFYLYAKSLIKSITTKEILLFCIPGILEFIFMVTMFSIPEKYSTPFRVENYYFFVIVYGIILPLFSITMLFLILRMVNKYLNQYLNVFSSTQNINLRWLKLTTIILLISYSFQLASLFSFLDENYRNLIYLIDSILSLLFLYWITVYGIRQSHVPDDFQIYQNAEPEDLDSSLKEEFDKLKAYLEANGIYKNVNLTVVELASLVDLHPKKVSAAINKFSNKNFNQFINIYRIEEAKKLLVNPEYDNFTIEAIANESGFNSKSVFNTLFKTETGQTPREFKSKNT